MNAQSTINGQAIGGKSKLARPLGADLNWPGHGDRSKIGQTMGPGADLNWPGHGDRSKLARPWGRSTCTLVETLTLLCSLPSWF